VSVKVGMA